MLPADAVPDTDGAASMVGTAPVVTRNSAAFPEGFGSPAIHMLPSAPAASPSKYGFHVIPAEKVNDAPSAATRVIFPLSLSPIHMKPRGPRAMLADTLPSGSAVTVPPGATTWMSGVAKNGAPHTSPDGAVATASTCVAPRGNVVGTPRGVTRNISNLLTSLTQTFPSPPTVIPLTPGADRNVMRFRRPVAGDTMPTAPAWNWVNQMLPSGPVMTCSTVAYVPL